MDESKLKAIVNYAKPVYKLYNFANDAGIALLKKLLQLDDKLNLFISFGGKKYDDSSKAIFEAMQKAMGIAGRKHIENLFDKKKVAEETMRHL